MKGLLLAGGRGTRLRPLTFTGNKHMIPIANQPILFYGLRNLALAGVHDVGIILGPLQEGIRERVGDGREFGVSVQYIEQGDPRGLADAVLCAREFLGQDPFLMYLGDNLLQTGLKPFFDTFAVQHPDAVVGVTPVTHPERYGVLEADGDRIVSIEEKPIRPRSNLALVGVYLFTDAVHEVVQTLTASARGELEITDAIRRLWQERGRVSVLHVDGWWKDTGQPGDLLEANQLVLRSLPHDAFPREGTIAPGATIHGEVGVGRGSVIASGARLTGPSLLGNDVRVSDGSEVGPDCSLGNGVAVHHASIRRSIVLDGARIEGVRVVDSVIGRNVEVNSTRQIEREMRLTIGDSSRVAL